MIFQGVVRTPVPPLDPPMLLFYSVNRDPHKNVRSFVLIRYIIHNVYTQLGMDYLKFVKSTIFTEIAQLCIWLGMSQIAKMTMESTLSTRGYSERLGTPKFDVTQVILRLNFHIVFILFPFLNLL